MARFAGILEHRPRVWALAVAVIAAVALTFLFATPKASKAETWLEVSHRTTPQVFVVFIDSLRLSTARDPHVMPNLVQLATEGVSLEAEPCRDRVTYLCLRSVFAGTDDSNLLGFYRNYDQSSRDVSDTLLGDLAARGHKAVGIGSHDFAVYAHALTHFAPFAKDDPDERAALALLDESPWKDARLVLIGFNVTDRVAHTEGFRSDGYLRTFSEVDRTLGEIRQRMPAGATLVVFGDHGHDTEGRHLPGGAVPTLVTITGPAVNPKVQGNIHLTDARMLLTVLLEGKASASYSGPPLHQIFSQAWLDKHDVALPAVMPRPTDQSQLTWGVALTLLLTVIFLGLAGGPSRDWGLPPWSLPAAAAVTFSSGLAYAPIRALIHNDDYNPERVLYLGVPWFFGGALGYMIKARNGEPRAARILAACGGVTLATLLMLFPSVNYYGATRAVVFAAIAATIGCTFFLAPRSARAWVLGATVSLVLATFYDVRGLETDGPAGMRAYVMKAGAFADSSWAAVTACVLAASLSLGIWRLPSAHVGLPGRLDRICASGLVALLLALEITGFDPSRWLFAGAAILWVLLSVSAARTTWSRLALGLLALHHMFNGQSVHTLPIQAILCGVFAMRVWTDTTFQGSAVQSRVRSLALVIAAILMMWPVIGMRLSGVDFRFMFAWVRPVDYEKYWAVIAAMTLVKLALPLALLVSATGPQLNRNDFGVSLRLLGTKVLLLVAFALGFCVSSDGSSSAAFEAKGELVVLTVAMLLFSLLPRSGQVLNRRVVCRN